MPEPNDTVGASPEPGLHDRPLASGDVLLGTYEVVEALGHGGMGRVYLCRHTINGRRYAIKIIRTDANDPEDVARFDREAAMLEEVQHDAVAAFKVNFNDQNRRRILVMEYVEGRSLADRLRDGPLGETEVQALWIRLSAALDTVHAKGIVHGDISPDNVILPGGDAAQAKLIDFGLARSADAELAAAGLASAGKLAWMAPEQLEANGATADHRADIYCLGLVIAAASGVRLPAAGSRAEAVLARSRVPGLEQVPETLRTGVGRLLQPDPARRPRSAAAAIHLWDAVPLRAARYTLAAAATARWFFAEARSKFVKWRGGLQPRQASAAGVALVAAVGLLAAGYAVAPYWPHVWCWWSPGDPSCQKMLPDDGSPSRGGNFGPPEPPPGTKDSDTLPRGASRWPACPSGRSGWLLWYEGGPGQSPDAPGTSRQRMSTVPPTTTVVDAARIDLDAHLQPHGGRRYWTIRLSTMTNRLEAGMWQLSVTFSPPLGQPHRNTAGGGTSFCRLTSMTRNGAAMIQRPQLASGESLRLSLAAEDGMQRLDIEMSCQALVLNGRYPTLYFDLHGPQQGTVRRPIASALCTP